MIITVNPHDCITLMRKWFLHSWHEQMLSRPERSWFEGAWQVRSDWTSWDQTHFQLLLFLSRITAWDHESSHSYRIQQNPLKPHHELQVTLRWVMRDTKTNHFSLSVSFLLLGHKREVCHCACARGNRWTRPHDCSLATDKDHTGHSEVINNGAHGLNISIYFLIPWICHPFYDEHVFKKCLQTSTEFYEYV